MFFVKIKHYLEKIQAKEISKITKYSDKLVYYFPLKHDKLTLTKLIKVQDIKIFSKREDIISFKDNTDKAIFLLNCNINHSDDIQQVFSDIKPLLNRRCRLLLITYNPYFTWIYKVLNYLKLRKAPIPTTFLKRTDLNAICKLTGYEIIRFRHVGYMPNLIGIGHIFNKILPLIPLLKWFSFTNLITIRPIIKEEKHLSLTILIPARNESGNIENALKRIPKLDTTKIEIIFIEGNSSDNTWHEIKRVSLLPEYTKRYNIKCMQQTGKGKKDAVILGFKHATCDLVTILDADLTMPPELLGRFYTAYIEGLADFINGNRLLYTMESKAMNTLNLLGNIFFAKMISWVLSQKQGDTLCGTKFFSMKDYSIIEKWNNDFGNIDPFGDFEFIFAVADMGIGSIDMPIKYKARTYGDTNIRRFRDGLFLFKMLFIAFIKIKL
jgi:hypothetical protein